MSLGATVIIVSFTLDYANVMAGGMPRPFHRAVFVMGLGIGVLSYAGAVMRRETHREQAVAA